MENLQDSVLGWRIDTEIDTSSLWVILLIILWLGVTSILMILADLLWWQWLSVIMITLVISYFRYLQYQRVVHITQPLSFFEKSIKQQSQNWFVYIEDINQDTGTQLWQCLLQSTYVNTYLVVLYFEVHSPLTRTLTVTIWRDQVVQTEWRKLQVLARYFDNNHT